MGQQSRYFKNILYFKVLKQYVQANLAQSVQPPLRAVAPHGVLYTNQFGLNNCADATAVLHKMDPFKIDK